MSHRFGWIRSKHDRRDFKFSVSPSIQRILPPQMNLQPSMPGVYDQGDLGSCTANAVNAVFEFDQIKQKMASYFLPSRLFTYYNERVIEGTVPYDSGAEMRDAIKAVVKYGVCPEEDWPYNIDNFADKPPQSCYDKALLNQGLVYSSIDPVLCQYQGVIASGFPFILGFTVYASFEDIGSDGVMEVPSHDESVLGGHAVVMVGYNNGPEKFGNCPPRYAIIRNSWGEGWGDKGHFYMPYEFLISQDVSDCWVLQTVEMGV